jgi:hypothetical protein
MSHLSFLLCRLGLQGFLLPSSSPCPPKLLAWHCNQQQLAIRHTGSGAVLLYDLSSGAPATAGNDVGGGVLSQAQQVLTHQLQQQVRAPLAGLHTTASSYACWCAMFSTAMSGSTPLRSMQLIRKMKKKLRTPRIHDSPRAT